jgi:UDP-GlcNAc3NAcA epimerase
VKIVSVLGARPQFVKAAVVSCALRQKNIEEVLVHTGQHYDTNMSGIFFSELGIAEPKHNLGVGSGPHGQQTARMLERIEQVLITEKPHWTLVYGDTNSTLAGALAATKLHIPVAHVEAGLRSWNRAMPEEINRILADHTSTLLFAPTVTAVKNLHREGIDGGRVRLVGDVMYDAALRFGERAETASDVLERYDLTGKDYVLATIHRAENTGSDSRLRAILTGLARIASQLPVILPLHPRTQRVISINSDLAEIGPLRIIPPLGYLDMVKLEKHARVIATDSGGVQKEAFFHRVPCVTLREETEWVELIELGWNRLAPPFDAREICSAIEAALDSTVDGHEMPYGDGHSAQHIACQLTSAIETGTQA